VNLWSLPTDLVDHYYPVERMPPTPHPSADFATQASRLEGVFRSARHAHSTLEKVGVVLGLAREARVSVAGEELWRSGAAGTSRSPRCSSRASMGKDTWPSARDPGAESIKCRLGWPAPSSASLGTVA